MNLLILLGLPLFVNAQCGQSSLSFTSSYIVGGQQANVGDFPWQLGLVDNGYLICGATYVEVTSGVPRAITAAHCVTNPNVNRYSLVFGMYNVNVAGNRMVVAPSALIKHSSYNSNTFANDIAIFQFNALDVSSSGAAPACLPTQNYYAGEMTVVSGWGTTSEGGSSASVLRYVWKSLMSYSYCNTNTGNAGDLHSSMLCAGETGKDACQGDSGGPLVALRGNGYQLVGVVSWGYGCGRDNYPGVYADTWNLRNWIISNL